MAETVVALVVAALTVALLAAMSVGANRRFSRERRLPLQWFLDGSIISTAPRPVVLAFTPVFAAVCLAGVVALTTFLEPRAGQEHLVIPANILVALMLLGVHALHLWLIERALQRQG